MALHLKTHPSCGSYTFLRPTGEWTEVRRRRRLPSHSIDHHEEPSKVPEHVEEYEELDFEFDEDILKKSSQGPRAPQMLDSDDDDDDSDADSEIADEDVNKILIVTQTPPSKKREGASRTGAFSFASWVYCGGAMCACVLCGDKPDPSLQEA